MRIPVFATLRGSLTISLFTLNVIVWFIPILMFTFAKVLVPLSGWRKLMSDALIACAEKGPVRNAHTN